MNYNYTNDDIFHAVINGDLEKLRQLVENGIELSNVPEREVISSSRGYIFEVDPSERTETNHFRQGFSVEPQSTDRTKIVFTESLMDCAVMTGNPELVRYMVEQKCDAAKSRGLYIATKANNLEMIKLLMEAQAEPCKQVYNKFPQHEEAFWYEDVKLQSPLELAAESQQAEAVEFFLRDTERLTSDNVSAAFMIAVSTENEIILRSFLKRWELFGQEVFSKMAEKVISKANPVLSRIFLTCGANIEPYSRCLAYALRTADTEAVKLMMSQGIRPKSEADWSRKYWENMKEGRRFDDWGRIRKKTSAESYYHSKSESLVFDDDYKYISWTQRGGVNLFSGYYGTAKQAPSAKRIEMIRTLASEKLLDEDELSYLYYLAVAGDDIPIAEALEEMGAAVTDFAPYSKRAGSDKLERSVCDLTRPAMSKEKAVFICRHLGEGEEVVLGNIYFDPQYDRTEMLLAALEYCEKVRIVDAEKALYYFYSKDSLLGIEKMAKLGALTVKNTAEYINKSVEDGKTELTAWFMDYRNKNFPQDEIDEESERDMWEL